MKNFLYGFIAALTVISMVGCSSILKNNEGVFGKAQKENSAVNAQVRHVENAQAQVNENTLSHIGAWSKGGVEYSLDQIKTNVPIEVTTAKEMNKRIEALAGKPDFDEVKEIEKIVDKLVSQSENIRNDGEKALAGKDREITILENSVKQLNQQREEEIAKAFAQADANAQAADQYKATLGQMDSWFGLGAVFYGVKKFIISAAWILGIGSILFIILRILSTSNPMASAIFGIFDQMGSWLVHTIQVIFPKAVSLAGNVSLTLFNSYKSTLTKIVDAVQMAQSNSKASGKQATIEDALNEAAKSMNADEKAIVDELKKALNWK